MGLFGNIFGKGESGGLMNVIRCDEQEFLVWKWTPLGQDVNSTSRENAIRYGSTLVVKPGEVAVFLYRKPGGGNGGMDYIEGPYQDTIKTQNFPILAGLMGTAFGGESPFQAEVYFINTRGNNQVKISVPYFDVIDPINKYLAVPIAVTGKITYNITDCQNFVSTYGLRDFDVEDFEEQIKTAVKKYVKAVVTNLPTQYNIPLVNIQSQILVVNDIIQQYIAKELSNNYGVNLKSLDISGLNIDKECEAYYKLEKLTLENTTRQQQQQADIAFQTTQVQADLNLKNMRDSQRINTENVEETLRMQRQLQMEAQRAQTEEAQRRTRMETETMYSQANILNKQVEMMGLASQGLAAGSVNMGSGGPGMNPGAMMAGMAMGNAMGQQMAGVMSGMGQQMQNAMNTPPPVPVPSANVYHVSVNGQQYGPFNVPTLQQMVAQGQINAQTMVWTNGMAQWAMASTVPELAILFAPPAMGGTPPPIPGGNVPPAPPTP